MGRSSRSSGGRKRERSTERGEENKERKRPKGEKKSSKLSKHERKKAELEELIRRKTEKKKQLLLQRMKETPEQRMQRKMEKRRRKEEKRLEQLKLYGGFTSESNPWGDSRLTERFVWGKKNEKLREQGLDPSSISKAQEEMRKRELLEELEKLKKRKAERELERQQWEEERTRLQREREMAEFADWEEKEDLFHLEQIKRKSSIRLQEGRSRPVDVLYKNLLLLQQPELSLVMEAEVDEPYMLLSHLNLEELQEVRRDILERIGLRDRDLSYWEALLVCCDDEIVERHRTAERERIASERRRFGLAEVPQEVSEEIGDMFSEKSYSELCAMERDMQDKIGGSGGGGGGDHHQHSRESKGAADEEDTGAEGGSGAVDVEYWENVLKRLQVFKAKAFLRDQHSLHLERHFQHLEKEMENQRQEAIAKGEYYEGWEEDHERKRVEEIEKRRMAAAAASGSGGEIDEAAELFMEEASRPMEEDEEVFTDEVQVDSKPYNFHDKYRPRKPRYFNRIHTGYDWNKYNSTHYDHDNPPPKTIQGYKFNIFYPDLIDKSKTPFFKLEPESSDTCIIRFHAGPPYEDLSFRIANKEWEYSRKRGYRNTFDRGVLQVHFRFKRYRYRR